MTAPQQRLERADLIRLAIHTNLGEHHAGGVFQGGQQMHLSTRSAATAQRLAVHRHRPPRSATSGLVLTRQPPADQLVQHGRIDTGQHPTQRGLGWWPALPGQRVTPYPKRCQHRERNIRGPLTDRGERPGPGQHRAHRDRHHRCDAMTASPRLARVR
jgi:hypothetical protein